MAGLLVMAIALIDVTVWGVALNANSMIAGSLLVIVGIQVVSFGAFATIAGEPIREATDPVTKLLVDRINLEHGATVGLLVFTAGALYSTYLLWEWVSSGYATVPVAEANILAFTACVVGVQIVFISFLLSSIIE